jgi:hypothetical protein
MKYLEVKLTLLCVGIISISLIFTALSSAKIDPKTLTGVWFFDEGKGDIAKDSSGKNNNGELMNKPKWVEGKLGNALSLDGVDDYVNVPNTFNLASASFSITALINVTANNASSDMGVVNRGDQTANTNIHLHCNIRAMKPHFGFYGNDLGGVTVLSTGKWYSISWVYDSSANIRRIYVNGVLDSEDKPPSKYQADHPLWIGRYYDLARVFNGLIDEVAIFNVALTEDDIKSIVKNGIGKATGIAAVSPAGKLTQSWAKIKAQ